MTIPEYLSKLSIRYRAGISTEHSYRADLQHLLESVVPSNILITNEPTRVKCGAPDFILTGNSIPLGYIEAKDLGADLSNKAYEDQFGRYRKALPNLIITNYLDFCLYKYGELVIEVSLGQLEGPGIAINNADAASFIRVMRDFCSFVGTTISSSKKLAEMMAGKARLLSTIINNALDSDATGEETFIVKDENITLFDQLRTFKNNLIHDLTHKEFSDIYAQTIAYGMFAARLHDPSLHDFTRQEAANLIPKTNPFLRKLFQYIAGYDLDPRITWIVDALADIFRATDVAALLKNFGTAKEKNDPIIHFYETFLAEYDPVLRKARGVWYTPEPVVNYIVRAVDDILKSDFGLTEGLADNSKIKIKIESKIKKTADTRSKISTVQSETEFHRVQILDPACGTGTFLAEVVKHIFKKFRSQQGIWSSYIENDLIPRLNGFELLMASYAIAHMKLDLLLTETGFKAVKEQRFKVFLTNSLEEYHPDTGTLFASWLSDEANQANRIKRDTPVMVIIGNPPYSIVSHNLAKDQRELVNKYKQLDGIPIKEKGALQFEKIINDDYVKFIALGEEFIKKNQAGILAYINNHNFLDSPQLRGLRWSLLTSFDKIYVLDLHGNAKRKEVSPDGSPDENIFDIQQGVSINIFVRTSEKQKGQLAQVLHKDCYGLRQAKYDFLWKNSLQTTGFSVVNTIPDNFLFVPRNNSLSNEYNTFIDLKDLFLKNSTGVITARDNLVINQNREIIAHNVETFKNSTESDSELCRLLQISEKKGWDIHKARARTKMIQDIRGHILPYAYRPFDERFIFYDESLVWTTARPIMSNFTTGSNLGLIVGKKGQVVGNMTWNLAFLTKHLTDFNMFYRGGIDVFPLFLNPQKASSKKLYNEERVCNLNIDQVNRIISPIGLKFETGASNDDIKSVTPENMLDYIYAVLYSPWYRTKYKDFLKSELPRIPCPKDAKMFWNFVKSGSELRRSHLLESTAVGQFITTFPTEGDSKVVKREFELTDSKVQTGKIWINNNQYFEGVPNVAWNFYIGGYQPAQKWLKDRVGQILTYDDVFHYQKIIMALTETVRIMDQLNEIPLA